MNPAFQPGVTTTLSVGASSTTGTLVGQGSQLRVLNMGPNIAYYKLGATAALTDTPLWPGVIEIFSRPDSQPQASCICAGGESATVSITVGEGQ